MNYYLAWLHFDTHGKMSTRLPDGHRVLEVLHTSSSNRHPPALWVLVEAVMATPSYTPAFGFPVPEEAFHQPAPPEYRQPPAPHPSMPFPMPAPVPSRTEQYDYGQQPQQEGRTIYSELSQETRDDDWRADTYGGGDFVPSVPMSPATGTPSNGRR